MKIGAQTRITSGFYFDEPKRIIIGNNSYINHQVHFHNAVDDQARVIIGDNVFFGPEVKIICASHEIGNKSKRAGKSTYMPVTIEDGAWICANVIILPGVKIARGCVIGAGAVVTKSTKPNGLYVGIPAKRAKDYK